MDYTMPLRSRFALVLLLLLLSACGSQPASAPAPEAALAAAPSATSEPAPIPSPSPSREPTVAPTATAAPSATPRPTREPTATAAPSATAVPTSKVPTADPTALAKAEGPIAPTAAPTVAGASIAASDPVRIVIGEIAMDRPLIPVGLDENRVPVVPNHDVGWYLHSARPGQGENVVLWGHVLRFRRTPDIPAPFARLKELGPGDVITVYSADGAAHRYVISEQIWATPDQVEYILPRGREMLTLVSCIGDKVIVDNSVEMTHRLITIAEPAR